MSSKHQLLQECQQLSQVLSTEKATNKQKLRALGLELESIRKANQSLTVKIDQLQYREGSQCQNQIGLNWGEACELLTNIHKIMYD
jgi:hypothetical protein